MINTLLYQFNLFLDLYFEKKNIEKGNILVPCVIYWNHSLILYANKLGSSWKYRWILVKKWIPDDAQYNFTVQTGNITF